MKKNPVVAGVLNFFFPGIGFAYLGTPVLIVCGVLYLLVELCLGFLFIVSGADVGAAFWFFDLFASVLMGFLAVGVALTLNERLDAALVPKPTAQPEATQRSANSVYCTHCGANNPGDAQYCHKCGKPIVSA